MNPADVLLLALILAALAWAVTRCIRNARSGKTGCGECAACGKTCKKRSRLD